MHIPVNPRNKTLSSNPHSMSRSNTLCSESKHGWSQTQNAKETGKRFAFINGCSWGQTFPGLWKLKNQQKQNEKTKENRRMGTKRNGQCQNVKNRNDLAKQNYKINNNGNMFLETGNSKPIESHPPRSLQLILLIVPQVFSLSWLTVVATDHPKNGMDPNTVAGKSCPERQKRCKDEQPLMIVVFETSPILSSEPQPGSRTNSVPIRYRKQAERSSHSQSNRAPT